VLTADYDRLELLSGDLVLDLGCGLGRHAYEALRRGASVVACDLGVDELRQVRAVAGVMHDAGDVGPTGPGVGTVVLETVNGDARRLPFANGAFDRVIASEVMEHIDDDDTAMAELTRVLRPGGTIAVTIPSLFPEKVCWSLSEDYHAPKATGGHVRIYRRQQMVSMLRAAGMVPTGHHRVHALHSPYWWLRCLVGPNQPIANSRLVTLYHRLLSWDIEKAPRLTRWTERALNPVLGKSLVIYATKPTEESARAAA
jgi:SAM-dependent methyltransferase